LPGVAVYLDNILVSGYNAKDHIQNLEFIEKGLPCRFNQCKFAKPYVKYLSHMISRKGISKGPKVNAIKNIPVPTDVTSLCLFLGSVQFYGKCIKDLATVAQLLYSLTKQGVP
jgi:hypothetical protein